MKSLIVYLLLFYSAAVTAQEPADDVPIYDSDAMLSQAMAACGGGPNSWTVQKLVGVLRILTSELHFSLSISIEDHVSIEKPTARYFNSSLISNIRKAIKARTQADPSCHGVASAYLTYRFLGSAAHAALLDAFRFEMTPTGEEDLRAGPNDMKLYESCTELKIHRRNEFDRMLEAQRIAGLINREAVTLSGHELAFQFEMVGELTAQLVNKKVSQLHPQTCDDIKGIDQSIVSGFIKADADIREQLKESGFNF